MSGGPAAEVRTGAVGPVASRLRTHPARGESVHGARVILGIETSCDETAAAVVTRRRDPVERRRSQAELHARYGGVVPEIASRRHLELVSPVIREALDQAGDHARRGRHGRRHHRPGADRRAARRRLRGQGARLGPRAAARAGEPPARPRRLALPAAARPRAAVHLPARERRPHAAPRRARPRLGGARVLGTTLDDAAGEAFDKGARLLGLAVPGRRRDRPAGARGRPGGLRLPGRARARARLLVLRAEDGAALRRPRPRRRDELGGAAGRSRRELPARDRPRARRAGRGGRAPSRSRSSAASRRTRSSAPRCPRPSRRRSPLCTDNAAMIASAARYTGARPGRRVP